MNLKFAPTETSEENIVQQVQVITAKESVRNSIEDFSNIIKQPRHQNNKMF